MKRALVIGATGFIGINIVDELLAQGVEVRVTRRPESVTMLLRKRAVERVEASLEEPEKLRQAMEGCDVVFLAGAHYPRYSVDRDASIAVGVAGVQNACEAALAAGVERFIYTSSVASLGRPAGDRAADEQDIPETMPTDSVYRAVKWAMEREVERAITRGLPAVTLLPGGCLGPGDLRVGTGGFVVGVARGEMPWWVEGVVNLIDVADVAQAHVRSVAASPGSRYCLGGHDVRVGWLLRHIASRYGGAAPSLRLSPAEGRERSDADERAAAPHRRRVPIPREMVDLVTSGQPVSNTRASRELDLTFTPLNRALDRAHAWFTRIGAIPAPRRHDEQSGPPHS